MVSNVHNDDKFDFVEIIGESNIKIEKVESIFPEGDFNTYKVTFNRKDDTGKFILFNFYCFWLHLTTLLFFLILLAHNFISLFDDFELSKSKIIVKQI